MTGKTLIKSISISGFFFFCSELGFSDLTFFFFLFGFVSSKTRFEELTAYHVFHEIKF